MCVRLQTVPLPLGKIGCAAAIVAVAFAWAGVGRASFGGPLTVEVLGWDPASERVYARQDGHDESGGERDCVFYFDLRAIDPTRPQVVERSRVRWSADSSEMARFARERERLGRFLAHLHPLARDDEGRESLLRHARIVEEAMARYSPTEDPERRFTVDAGDSILVTAWREHRVHAVRRYRIPGREARLVVLSFLGDPWEGGYEVQRCALVGLPATRVQRLDGWYGVLRRPAPR